MEQLHLVVDEAPSFTCHVASRYGFNFYDADSMYGLGCYRFEVQSFDDPAWKGASCAPVA